MLIRLGATPIRTSDDILEALHLESRENNLEVQQSLFNECSPEEKKMLTLLTEPLTRDEIIRRLERPTSETSTILAMLEIKGLIVESLGCIRRAS
jgi:predicted Rossmann fold nucleotide-binding protein DprA/Smf involved in DNA uptake